MNTKRKQIPIYLDQDDQWTLLEVGKGQFSKGVRWLIDDYRQRNGIEVKRRCECGREIKDE